MIEKARSLLAKLKDHLLPVAVSFLLIIFYLYIPFIHGRLNAEVPPQGPVAPVRTASLDPAVFSAPVGAAPEKTVQADAAPEASAAPSSSLPERPVVKAAALKKAVFFDAEKPAPDIDVEPGVKDEPAEGPEKKAAPAVHPRKRHAWPPDITRGDASRMELAITFDGGYKASEALVILNTLRARGIKTTIFLTGVFIKRHPGITRLIVLDGHEVGNHTMTHPHLTEYADTYRQRTLPWVDEEMLIDELEGAEEAFREATGREMAPLWRAPYGEVNGKLRAWAFARGYLHIGWTYDPSTRQSLDSLDWVYDTASRHYLTQDEIKERIVEFGREGSGVKGGIVLMHLGTERRTDTASAVLGDMIDELTSKGYRFVKVSELIEGDHALMAAARKKAGAYELGRKAGNDTRLDGKGPS